MGTVHHFPPRMRLVQPGVRKYLGEYRAREIFVATKHIADAGILLAAAGQIDDLDGSGFILAQYHLENALFHACCLTGALNEDRELTSLLLRRKMEREGLSSR